MKTTFVILIAALLGGCSQKQTAKPTGSASANEQINATGLWEANIETYDVRFYITENSGILSGVVTFPGHTNYGAYPLAGLRSQNRMDFHFEVPHLFPMFTNRVDSYNSYEGIINGDTVSGIWLNTRGVVRFMTNWSATRTKAEVTDAPAINAKVLIEHEDPLPPDTNMIALSNSLAELKKSYVEYSNASKAFVSQVRQPVRTNTQITAMKSGIPTAIYNQIAADAARRYPIDYEMQISVIKLQTEAYRKLHP